MELLKRSTHRECLDAPDHDIFVCHVFTAARASFKLWTVSICWHWDNDLHIVCCRPFLKLTLCFDKVFHPAVSVSLYHRLHPDQRLHLEYLYATLSLCHQSSVLINIKDCP